MRNSKSVTYINGGFELSVYGLFMFCGYEAGEESAKRFLDEYINKGILNFEECTGAFKVKLKEPNKTIYFSDNAGMMRYFINATSKTFCDTLPEAVKNGNNFNLDYAAIAQFLWFGCIYGMDTIVTDIKLSNPDSYYVIENNCLSEHSKNLTPFESMNVSENEFEKQMMRFVKATKAYKEIGCTITGGVDSRSVLAHLIYNGIKPSLSITGSKELSDVKIAKEIAATLNLNIMCVEGIPEEKTIEEMLNKYSGTIPIHDAYRLFKRALIFAEEVHKIECGGLAGELYKNSFINQDFPFYYGKPNWKRFLKYKLITKNFPKGICGKKLEKHIAEMHKTMYDYVSSNSGKNKANAYLNAGYKILQSRSAGVVCMGLQYYIPYNPLLERKVVAMMFNTSPYNLEMQHWQRTQVTKFCPKICDIKTDRGMTCNNRKILTEFVKNIMFMLSVAWKRIFRRKMHVVTNAATTELLQRMYADAINICVKRGIIASNINIAKMPSDIADRIFSVGYFLKNICNVQEQ